MAVTETIQELLQGIDDAQYGRDMRQYIHKGIQKCYEEGSAGETDLVARESIDDLAANLQVILGDFATVETSIIASKAYGIGDKLVLNYTLYRVTRAIAAGGHITVYGSDRDVVKTTVEEEQNRVGVRYISEEYNKTITPPVSDAVVTETDTIPPGTYLILAYMEASNSATDTNLSMNVCKGSTSGSFSSLMFSERGTGHSKMFNGSSWCRLTEADTIQMRVSNGSVSANYTGILQIIRLSDSIG